MIDWISVTPRFLVTESATLPLSCLLGGVCFVLMVSHTLSILTGRPWIGVAVGGAVGVALILASMIVGLVPLCWGIPAMVLVVAIEYWVIIN
ncbi:MAG: hypothetical protein GX600_01645 [Dehalococcoidia bacterium]|nr:hypothetical protein [Dehalococcoidia bacterium]